MLGRPAELNPGGGVVEARRARRVRAPLGAGFEQPLGPGRAARSATNICAYGENSLKFESLAELAKRLILLDESATR